MIAEWIRFADAKAAVVQTLGGAIAGLVIPTLKSYLNEDQTTRNSSGFQLLESVFSWARA